MEEKIVTTDELMQRLAKAVGPGGDFPVRLKVLSGEKAKHVNASRRG
jgi:hypothetical protein